MKIARNGIQTTIKSYKKISSINNQLGKSCKDLQPLKKFKTTQKISAQTVRDAKSWRERMQS